MHSQLVFFGTDLFSCMKLTSLPLPLYLFLKLLDIIASFWDLLMDNMRTILTVVY
jgi:Na+/citrate or Na+/malate symporter